MPLNVLKTPKTQILEIYSKLVMEYFGIINESDIMREMNFPISSVYIGLNAIHRVFEIILIKTKSIEKTYHYSQRAYYYYLEYIEQIYNANLSQNINHMDIILFVYKKTIFDMYDGEPDDNSITLTNIMTLNDETINFDEKECRTLLLKLTRVINVLFFWENTNIKFSDRHEIANNYLYKFINKIEIINNTLQYLEIIQEKIKMNNLVYDSLLKELLKKLDLNRSKLDSVSNESVLMKFYVEQQTCQEKFEAGNMREFVKWLYY
jgi:hypothetical protein